MNDSNYCWRYRHWSHFYIERAPVDMFVVFSIYYIQCAIIKVIVCRFIQNFIGLKRVNIEKNNCIAFRNFMMLALCI